MERNRIDAKYIFHFLASQRKNEINVILFAEKSATPLQQRAQVAGQGAKAGFCGKISPHDAGMMIYSAVEQNRAIRL